MSVSVGVSVSDEGGVGRAGAKVSVQCCKLRELRAGVRGTQYTTP